MRRHFLFYGDLREAICRDDEDRQKLSAAPREACLKTEGPVYVYCLIGIHQDG